MNKDKRFIEESFPVKEVSTESAREKNIRHGHISTLHIWWARKPLASSRATNYAALIPAPEDIEEWQRERQFIIELCKWENSNNERLLERARKRILKANGGEPPRVLDPFAGGGAIPLEALRLGCETYAGDLNPVAVLIEKCTLEYPQKYGKKIPRKQYFSERPWLPPSAKDDKKGELFGDDSTEMVNPLLEDVKYWGNWVMNEAKKEIGRFYPNDPDGSIPVGYYWMHTIPCQNPTCNSDIPLTVNWWLAKKKNKKVALYPFSGANVRSSLDKAADAGVSFKIVGNGYEEWPAGFNPENGSVSRAVATCPVCGSTVEADATRRLFREGKAGQRLIAVVTHKPGTTGKKYRIAIEQDMAIFKEAEYYLQEKREQLMLEWGMDPVPDELLPPKESHRAVGSQLPLYGFKVWGDLFNARQKLALITFVEKVRQAQQKMQEAGIEAHYARAVGSYLAVGIDNITEKNNVINRWANTKETIAGVFSRQALPMVWDYFESNMFSGSTGDWHNAIDYNLKVIILCTINSSNSSVSNFSSTSLEHEEEFFHAVFTDPPYYDLSLIHI